MGIDFKKKKSSFAVVDYHQLLKTHINMLENNQIDDA